MPLVTILTPTYNRAHTLPRLFESLCSQTKLDFEWLIIDDGSTDNTEQICNEFAQSTDRFIVRYVRKTNGGKHTALNVGIKGITSKLTMIVDSDDYLTMDAIESICFYYEKYKTHKDLGCFSFLRCNENREILLGLDSEEFITSYIEYRIKQNRPGDMAEVFFTDVLKAHPFPEFEGEYFLSEDVVWIEIGKKYNYCFINKPIYICEYLEGGLTANDKPMKFASPLGSMMRGKQLMSKECGLKVNIKGAIIYNCYKKCLKKTEPYELKLCGSEKILGIFTILLGELFYKKWKLECE